MNPLKTHGEPDAVPPPPAAPEHYLSLVFNSAANMMALFQVGAASSLRLLSCNRAYLSVIRAAGYPLEASDLIGKTLDELFLHVFKFDRDDCQRHLERYREVLATNRPVSYEEIHDTPNGRYYGETTLSPVPAPDGACAFVLFSSNDVTERRRAEEVRRQLEGQLQQAQKLQAIGTLAGGIAHDFNNIITAMLGNAQLLLLDLPRGSLMAGCAQQIVEGSHRARDLVQQILTFSRAQRRERVPARLQPCIAEVLSLLRSSLPSHIEIRTELPAAEPEILMDAAQMQQVLMNLCLNSAHAMRAQGGSLTIRESVVAPEDRFRRTHPALSAGPCVRLQISDTGHGMNPQTLQRIFEPFFTTKGTGEGTGLGLAVVHGIVEAHDGVIEVESSPGQGAVFSLLFPAVAAAPTGGQPTAPRPGMRPAGGGEHILFVDDEEAVRQLGKPILERFGYRVTTLSDGPAALAWMRQHPREADAIISDLTMPEMSGSELAQEVERLQPGLPFVIMTGHGESSEVRPVNAQQILSKPFTLDELAKAVRTALDRAK